MRRRRSLTATFAVVSLVAMAVMGVALVVLVSQLIKQQALDSAAQTATAYATAGIEEKVSPKEWASEQLTPQTLAELRKLSTSTTGVRLDNTLLGFRLWGTSGRNMYDSQTGDAGTVFPDVLRLDSALVGRQPSPALVTEVRPDLQSPSGAAAPSAGASTTATEGASAAPSRPATVAGSPGPTQRTGADSSASASASAPREIGSDLRTVLDVYVPAWSNGRPVGVIDIVLNYGPTAATTGEAVRNVAILVLSGLGLVWLLLYRTVRNASQRLRQSASENARLALLDPLTGLPNRRLLSERLERAVDTALEEDSHVALLLLDIDRFKEINDSLGHDRGDMLLIEVSRRLQAVVRDTDTVARLGGDEFAVLLPTVRGVDDAAALAQRAMEVFGQPYDIDGLMLHVEGSLGLALLPEHARDVSSLLKRADVAMYAAKASRRGMSIYSAEGDASSPAKLVLLGDLRQAIDSPDQLSVHYQPKLDLHTGAVAGLEALLRWNHPVRGTIPPSEFIPLAEQTGLVHSLTRRVLQLVLTQMREWQRGGWEIQVAVNLSALNLAEPDLDERIAELLAEYGIPARLLEFEITESAIVQDPEGAAVTLSRIAAMGSTIALDDFGIGNTSISQLRALPIDTLKIDQSFVTDMSNGGDVLVKVVTDLAHEFRMVAVAEGVEDIAVADKLRSLGCDLAQGYLYARPVPASELMAVLTSLGAQVPAAAAPPPADTTEPAESGALATLGTGTASSSRP